MKRVIHFTRLRYASILLSAVLLVGGFTVGMLRGGFNFGVDFSAGMSQRFQINPQGAPASIGDVRQALAPLGQFDLQAVGDPGDQQFVVKVQVREQEEGFQDRMEGQIRSLLGTAFGAANVTILATDFVGPRYSQELVGQTVSIVAVALVLILIYAAFRFHFNYGAAAVLCLIHDALFMVALTLAFQIEFTTVTIAAILTIVGYSINDTIVIFDRVRENLTLMRESGLEYVFDTSITQTLGRTVLTSLTTLFAVGVLLVFGTGSVRDFSELMLIGVIEGTYSTVFIASPIVLWLENAGGRRRRAREVKKFGHMPSQPAVVRGQSMPAAERPEAGVPAPMPPRSETGTAPMRAEERPSPEAGVSQGAAGPAEAKPVVSVSRVQPTRKKRKKRR
jgi:preprotein translocase subunit SecF